MGRRHPDWLKVRIGAGEQFTKVKQMLRAAKLHTICEEAKCPNIAECFGCGTAVFLILGNICTRDCQYCHVTHGTPGPINEQEPIDIAQSVKALGLKYVVITSVTRDDLSNGGAHMFYETVREIKKLNEDCSVEVLIPDFQANQEALQTIIDAKPDVINHNIEVVKELFPFIRPQGHYLRSLQVLRTIKLKNKALLTKSGFMVGLGETHNQILSTMRDLREAKVDFLTVGQYLQPTKNHAPVVKYYTPQQFLEYKNIALQLGFKHVESGPLVRSSYHAHQALSSMV